MIAYLTFCVRIALCVLLVISSCNSFGKASQRLGAPGEIMLSSFFWLFLGFGSAFLAVAVLFVS